MKINVLIADDEYFIRQRIKKIIPWDALGFTYVGEAENGLEVIQHLESKQIDLLLLDIKMPMKSGIEVAGYIHDKQLATRIIILSGYNDFSYAQQALRYGVIDYLVKPISEENLIKSLLSSKDALISAQKENYERNIFQNYTKRLDLKQCLKNNNISALLEKHKDLQAYKYTQFIGLFTYSSEELCIHNFIECLKPLNLYLEFFRESEYITTIQLFLESNHGEMELISYLEDYIINQEGPIFLVIGKAFLIHSNWDDYFKKITNNLSYRYYHPDKTILKARDIAPAPTSSVDVKALRKDLLYHLTTRKALDYSAFVDNLFEQIQGERQPATLPLLLTEFFTTLLIYYPTLIDSKEDINQFVKTLIDEEYSITSLQTAVKNYGLVCMEQNERPPSDVLLTNKLTSYINEHYADIDLTVAKIASIHSLTPSYMGSVFKKISNQSLIQYITSCRMEKAKELLDCRQYRITDVAQMVGYGDIFYFSKRFKKMYGQSPKDYSLGD